MLRIPHCLDNRLTNGGKVVSPMHPPHFTPYKHYFSASGTDICPRLSKPQGQERLEGQALKEWPSMSNMQSWVYSVTMHASLYRYGRYTGGTNSTLTHSCPCKLRSHTMWSGSHSLLSEGYIFLTIILSLSLSHTHTHTHTHTPNNGQP
jgi:hypothetical protein